MKKRSIFLCIITFLICYTTFGQSRIKAYFNHPVNTTVSHGVNAIYLPNGKMADTIVAYINRAKYSLDIAQYDYNQSTNYGAYANIAAAVNSAYLRGVTVRWIYNGSSSNTGLSQLNNGIPKLARASSSNGIMHHKFMIFDEESPNKNDPVICTGSDDWSSEMFYQDYNNILFIQDSALAYAYTAQFNQMWGSSGGTPNAANAKFGSSKSDLGMHNFMIDGKLVNLYFSPTDGTNSKILNAILSADTDIYFGVYTFTESANANSLVAKKNAGVYTLGIVDQYTSTASANTYNILTSGLGAHLITYKTSTIYHNKLVIIDPSNSCSDPQVLTGSHNWTVSADTYNDENTLIIHSDTLANIYCQAFNADFTSLGGTVDSIGNCTVSHVGINKIDQTKNTISIYPNPSSSTINIHYETSYGKQSSIEIFSVTGQKIGTVNEQGTGEHSVQYTFERGGIYFIRFRTGDEFFFKKVVICKE